jgi:hypothetical protein
MRNSLEFLISFAGGKLSEAWILDGEQVRGYSKITVLMANLGPIRDHSIKVKYALKVVG